MRSNPAARARAASSRSCSGNCHAWMSAIAQDCMPSLRARAKAARAATASTGAISTPCALTRPVRLEDLLVKRRRQANIKIEKPRPRLCADLEQIRKAAIHNQERARALALQERVGRNRGSHFDDIDGARRECARGSMPRML
jgi:hypothetical protein